MSITYLTGDIIDRKFDDIEFIAQQCNCVTWGGRGLYTHIVSRYKEADIYKTREGHSTPGTIQITGRIIHMFAQHKQGGPSGIYDSEDNRLIWFNDCLEDIGKLNPKSIAFPYKIGCGLAKGKWYDYENSIKHFAIMNPYTKVYIIEKNR